MYDLPSPVSASNYSTQIAKLLVCVKSVFDNQIVNAVQKLIKIVLQESDQEDDHNCSLDVAVAYDGTWSARGFIAKHGIGVVISSDIGEILDLKIL